MIDTSNKEIQSHYDYIVVGAGAAGSVLAAELSASGAQVLVIESGGPDDAPTIANPSIWFYNVAGPLDYHLPIVPSPRLNNRKFNMALGHVLGGGTSINAMVWMRGMQRDYDGWAENGAKGWAFADVLSVFKKQEDWEGGASEWRGSGGPIHIRRPKDPHPTAPAFIEAAQQMGMPILDDVNGPMRPGAGYINMNIAADGTRVSAVRAFLRPALSRPNLTLLLNTNVCRVVPGGDWVMVGFAVVTRAALLIARRASSWAIDEHLGGLSPECVAVDLRNPAQVYCGTARDGLFRSRDSGPNWEPVGPGIDHPMITAVDVGQQADGFGIVYAGTEPSAVFRSDNGGESWVDLAGLRALASADTWSFPPRPDTHHVRWIEADVSVADRVFVAIEAGALVRTFDGGRTWRDRVRGGPYDTHTSMTHPLAPGRIYSAAGDGYFESTDAGDSWRSPEDGLKHRYLVDIAVDPADPDTVIVSAADGPGSAYSPRRAESYVYRKTGLNRWEQAMRGLPEAKGTTVSRFATHAAEPGVIYAANNRGLFRSDDAGRSWKALDLPWPQSGLADGVAALACLPE